MSGWDSIMDESPELPGARAARSAGTLYEAKPARLDADRVARCHQAALGTERKHAALETRCAGLGRQGYQGRSSARIRCSRRPPDHSLHVRPRPHVRPHKKRAHMVFEGAHGWITPHVRPRSPCAPCYCGGRAWWPQGCSDWRGRAKLLTNPLPTGSTTFANTTGRVRLA